MYVINIQSSEVAGFLGKKFQIWTVGGSKYMSKIAVSSAIMFCIWANRFRLLEILS